MKTINYYCDKAKELHGYKSDRELGLELGLKTSAVNQWRKGRSFPSDDTMCRLSWMTGEDLEEALLNLNIWRSSGAIQRAYQGLMARLTAAAVAGLVTFAPMGTKAAQSNIDQETVYIMENTAAAFLRRLYGRLYPTLQGFRAFIFGCISHNHAMRIFHQYVTP